MKKFLRNLLLVPTLLTSIFSGYGKIILPVRSIHTSVHKRWSTLTLIFRAAFHRGLSPVKNARTIYRKHWHNGMTIFTLIVFVLPLIINSNVNGKHLAIYNLGTASGVGDSNMSIHHMEGAEEMYDKHDFPWSRAPPDPGERWLKVYSDPYGEELDGDSRPINSTTSVHLKLKVVKNPVTSPNKIKIYIMDYTNFTWKNIIAEQYCLGDVNEPNDIKASYDVKQYAGQSILLDELVNQSPDIVYDNWMIRFYNHADLNRDQKVDFEDYAIWAMNYGRTNTMPRNNTNDLGAYADIDRSGIVDCNDLSLFSGEWLWDANDPNTWSRVR